MFKYEWIIDLSDLYKMYFQRLAGATLLIFANKQDLPGALSSEEIKEVYFRNITQNTCKIINRYIIVCIMFFYLNLGIAIRSN